jgi:hypothetical protein
MSSPVTHRAGHVERMGSCMIVQSGRIVGLVLLAGSAVGGARVGGGDAPPMKTVSIMDPAFGIAAVTMQIPADWSFAGTVLRGPNCSGAGPMFVFRASSPDGLTGVQMVPRYDFAWGNTAQTVQFIRSQHCVVRAPSASSETVKSVFLAAARPGAVVDAVGPLPNDKSGEQAAQANANAAAIVARAPFHMEPIHYAADGARLRIHYTYRGQAIEEWIEASTTSMDTPQPGGVHLVQMQTTIVGERAPQGQLDALAPLLETIAHSTRLTPEWKQRQQEVVNQQNQAVQQSQRDFAGQMDRQHQQTMANIAATGQASRNAAAATQGAIDRSAAATAQSMGDQQTYVNPSTGGTTVQSNQYGHTFSNGQGRVIQSNSPTYDPNASERGQWVELQPTAP